MTPIRHPLCRARRLTPGLALIGLLASGCGSGRQATPPAPSAAATVTAPTVPPAALPEVCIYKMKKDYSQHVPVLMDDSRTRIVSYPAPTDLVRGGRLTLPTRLEGGYWLDNRGITANVAFLTYTYEAYSRLPQAPSRAELEAHILDRQPLEAFRRCGSRSQFAADPVPQLNALIRKNGW